MKIRYHILIIIVALFLLVGLPLYFTGFFDGDYGVDSVSSATMIIDKPSGSYVVMINPDFHPDKDKLATWRKFFSGEEIDFLFEDISCVVADVDTAGLDIAKSFQSRLPENQMTVRIEDITLMLSKAMIDKYDVIILSKEIFDAYKADYGMENSIILEEQN